jgi:hypothetical protein
MILGIVAVLAGILVVRFRKTILKESYSWQKENLNLKFGKKQFRTDEIICVIVGSVLILGGVTDCFGSLERTITP